MFLCNGRSTTVSCSAYDSMPQVLEVQNLTSLHPLFILWLSLFMQTLASSIGLEPQFTYYFRIMLEYSEQTPTDSDDTTAPQWKCQLS